MPMTPQEIVSELDNHIVGQGAAKRPPKRERSAGGGSVIAGGRARRPSSAQPRLRARAC